MRRNRFLRVLGIVAVVTLAINVMGFVVMNLWNWLMPAVFGLKTVTFLQALGLLVLGKILFGGFHRHGRGPRGWRRHMAERWEHMSPEERERFRAGIRGRWGCGFGPDREPAPEQKPL
ncbi:MAG TPA: hypothetical protein VF865_10285 [Acidobacteriaceae bacterium]